MVKADRRAAAADIDVSEYGGSIEGNNELYSSYAQGLSSQRNDGQRLRATRPVDYSAICRNAGTPLIGRSAGSRNRRRALNYDGVGLHPCHVVERDITSHVDYRPIGIDAVERGLKSG